MIFLTNSYKKRIYKALQPENRSKILSMIIDGMDQQHSKLPYLGSQGTLSSTLTQGINGVLVHGVGVTLYRTFETVYLKLKCFKLEMINIQKKFISKLTVEQKMRTNMY